MSFKYRFILSFVLLEVFFILLIVSVNFFTISNSSKNLINEKIESNTVFLEQIVKVPISIYDIATLDDLHKNSIKYMNSIVILDSSNRVLSSHYSYKHMKLEKFLKLEKNLDVNIDDEFYKIVYKKIFEDDIFIGSIYMVFDLSNNYHLIENNTKRTLFIIFIEILISTLMAYIIGTRLTNKLTLLSDIAFKIGTEEKTEIPFLNSSDEIGKLSKSMNLMQENLFNRNKELKEYNDILKKQKYELIAANKAKDDFLANMSHELKTPLNSINVISDLMMRNRTNNLDNKQVKNLEIVNKCGKDLLFLINDILDLSKLEAGQIILNNDTLNVKELMTSIYDMFRPQTRAKNIDFVFKFDNEIESIFSDQDRIKQIIKNLLSNALKFTQEGKISLIVENYNDKIKIKVKDEGIGIPEDKLEHIFDRFKQVDGSTTRKYGGTGLGLSICKELCELLDGTISVRSEVNKGSIFEVILPKKEHLIIGLDLLEIKKDII